MTITEAGACGTPSVATRIAGHVDVIDDGRNGLLVKGPTDLEDALGQVLGDAILRTHLGSAARERAEGLSWDHTALGVLRGVAGQLAP
jgi:glycosyltransferase involved in cell wall biosynthesis